jgi:GWxTD domain-containing protein
VKNTLLISLLLFSSLIAQPSRREGLPVIQQPFQSETIVIGGIEDNLNFFYTYKIPYNRLVFERDNGEYSAGFRVLVEITDSESNFIDRDIKDTYLKVDDFEATNEQELFLQDFLNFEVPEGEFNIKTTITDLNSQNELKLEPEKVNLNGIDTNVVLHPLVIETSNDDCGNEKTYKLANFGGTVPFSPNDYHLIIPLSDTTLEKIIVTIINNEDTLLTKEIVESYTLPVGISKCKNNLVVQLDDKSIPTKNFVIRNVNRSLREGRVQLNVKLNDDKSEEFKSEVVWIDKPFSLRNPEMAIELLSYIENDSIIYRMLEADETTYPKVLGDYWTSFDPTPETSYNQLMTEYYKRIDHAAREFRGLGKDNGIKTDRGMIYIRFGEPDAVERSSNTQGQVVETWIYKNPERKFVFVDKRGIGNFTLIES